MPDSTQSTQKIQHLPGPNPDDMERINLLIAEANAIIESVHRGILEDLVRARRS